MRARLLLVWVLSLATSIVIGVLLANLSRQSSTARVGRAEAVVARACDMIRDRYDFYTAGWSGPPPAPGDLSFSKGLAEVVAAALEGQTGVEGGIWRIGQGPVAFAFPTENGTGFPEARRDLIRSASEAASNEDQAIARTFPAASYTQFLVACPLGGPVLGLTAWTMTTVWAASSADPLRIGLGVLLGLMVAISATVAWLIIAWSRHLGRIETALAAGADGVLPMLERTGERELDRLVAALNEAGSRLRDARRRSAELAERVATAERLAALGRVAAGVAHEIRNPIAAMRLKAENALVGDDGRRRQALTMILGQIERLDRLAGELLAATQARQPAPRAVDLESFVRGTLEPQRDQAAAAGVMLDSRSAPGRAVFDPALIQRVLDNLLLNALQHTPAGGRVILSASRACDRLRFVVEDSGPGVRADLRGRLFEPFATGRPEGTGLGLAIARELAEAHGGKLTMARPGGDESGEGAAFALELPWREF